MKSKNSFLFACVHPDDLEFSCSNIMKDLHNLGHELNILSMTKGEFGIFEEEWKGPRLARIRKNELIKAAKISGIPKEHVFFGNIIDGFVRFTRENVNYVKNWLNKLRPDIVFCPEAYFTYYWHPDHISLGKILYYIFRWENNSLNKPIKKLYFYTTARPNFFWPFNDLSHIEKTLSQHKSQWWVLKWNYLFSPIDKKNIAKRKIGKWKYAERYRQIDPNGHEPKSSLLLKGILGLISSLNVINPPDSHFKVPKMDEGFGLEVKKLREKYNFKD